MHLYAFVESMLFISKKQLVPNNANLSMVFICKLFQSNWQVGQLKSYGVSTGLVHVKMVAVFITNVQHLAETLLSKIHTYMAHAVAFAAIRTTKTREHFAESSYATQLRVQTMHNTRIVLPVASTIARAEICLGC